MFDFCEFVLLWQPTLLRNLNQVCAFSEDLLAGRINCADGGHRAGRVEPPHAEGGAASGLGPPQCRLRPGRPRPVRLLRQPQPHRSKHVIGRISVEVGQVGRSVGRLCVPPT